MATRHPLRLGFLFACSMLMLSAHAQIVPKPEHILRTTLAAEQGKGLSLNNPQVWPHWEGRIGVALDRPFDPLKDTYVLAQPAPSGGFSLRSAHVLSDYHFANGFRATLGLLKGSITQSYWSDESQGSGLNLSVQHLDTLNIGDAQTSSSQTTKRTFPYVGAGYASTVRPTGTHSMWRFNADLGLISINSNNIDRISRAFQGEASLDEVVRDLRFRPVIKVSVRYAF